MRRPRSPEPGVRCHGDSRATGLAPESRGAGVAGGLGSAGPGVARLPLPLPTWFRTSCPGRVWTRPPLTCPQESWTPEDNTAAAHYAPNPLCLLLCESSELSLLQGPCTKGRGFLSCVSASTTLCRLRSTTLHNLRFSDLPPNAKGQPPGGWKIVHLANKDALYIMSPGFSEQSHNKRKQAADELPIPTTCP